MGYDSLIGTLIKFENTDLIIEWESGLQVIGRMDTIFETDNGLEDSDVDYKEYHAGVFQADHIVTHPTNKESIIYNWLVEKKGSLIEISLYDDPPIAIYLKDGHNVWRRDSQT